MRKNASLISLIFIFFLTACSNDEPTAEERLEEYVGLWNEQNFEEMYEMLDSQSTEEYPVEQYVDRYQKIYEDLNVENLEVSFEAGEEETTDQGPATYPIHVDMETIAGPVSFDYEATMVQQETEEETNWFVDWDPGYIFPQLADGGDLSIDTIQPERGDILDQNGESLAINGELYNFGVIPNTLGDDPGSLINELADLLEMDAATIEDKLNANWVEPDMFVPLKEVPRDNEEQVARLLEVEQVQAQKTMGRIYPYGESASHLVGYVGSITAEELENRDPALYTSYDMIGKRGIEQLFDERLKGQRGVRITAVPESGEEEVIAENEVVDGEDISLTIDIELQEEIYALYQEDGRSGTAAAIHPKTGETLALVSAPGFNPIQMTYGMSSEQREEMQENEQQPLLNRFSANFSPGSTIKPIVAAIGLENGSLDPEEGKTIEGKTWQKDESWDEYRVTRASESNGPVDLTDALVRSDNIYFAQEGLEMGEETLVSGLQQFGFDEDLPYTYPIEDSTISNSGTLDSEGMIADTSFGQGQLQVSSLHLATAYTPLLNDGNLIQPVLETTEETSQVWKESLVSSENITIIRDALRQVVTASNGTAQEADIEAANLSGKTGTAELKSSLEEEGAAQLGWFVTYTEEEDLLVSMMVEDVQDDGGSHYVVQKVADLFQEIR